MAEHFRVVLWIFVTSVPNGVVFSLNLLVDSVTFDPVVQFYCLSFKEQESDACCRPAAAVWCLRPPLFAELRDSLKPGVTPPLPLCFCPTGWGSVAYCGGAEKDPRGAHEAGAGPSEAAEGGAENDPRQGQVQAQALLHPEGHWMRLLPLRPTPPIQLLFLLLLIIQSHSSSSSSVERSLHFGSAEGRGAQPAC